MPFAKTICLLAVVFSFHSGLSAQDKLKIKFGKVAIEDFNLSSPVIDSSTNAVVVADVGRSEFMANTSELTFSLTFKQKKRIKIINKNGFDAATVIIPLYVVDNNAEKLDDFEAATYNIENGSVVKTKVDRSSIFTEKHSKNWIYKKFTFPALKEGSIIEYSYQVKSDFFFNLQSWVFQSEYPVMWSEYEADIPEFFQFVILSQGYHPFFINKNDASRTSFTFVSHNGAGTGDRFSGGSTSNSFNLDGAVDRHTWVMKDVPGLKQELYTTTLGNSIAKIEFQLNQIKYPNSFPKTYMDSWEKVATDLMAAESFGIPISRPNNWLDNETEKIVQNAKTPMAKAQKIYEYVRDNFTCNDVTGIYTTTGLKEVFRSKSGSVADINMLLIAMLKNQRIETTPVILSTRSHGFTHELYPLMNRYNYVIAKAVLDNDIFYLDATTPQLAFSKLPSEVYNGQAREIAENQALPVYFLSDSLRESDITRVYITNLDNGSVAGNLNHCLGFYESLNLRHKMKKTQADDFKKAIRQEYPEEIAVENVELDSLKLFDNPVGIKYDLKFNGFSSEDIVYFNPMLSGALKKNPFAAASRYYPVEMPYTIDHTYTLTMQIPKGYQVDELPKSVRLNFNEDEGMFEYIISSTGGYISMRSRLMLKKSTYLNEDYEYLRDFYSFIVKKEAEQIVFKKAK